MSSLADFAATSITGTDVDLGTYAGDVVLVVNTASHCGFTGQYEGLESLHRKYGDQGLRVLAFPCDQFNNQEFDDEEQISQFCSSKFGVSFPMFAKVDVNGPDAHPLFSWLRSSRGGVFGSRIKWNFTKFLIGRDGQVLQRYSPTTKPEDIDADIARALG